MVVNPLQQGGDRSNRMTCPSLVPYVWMESTLCLNRQKSLCVLLHPSLPAAAVVLPVEPVGPESLERSHYPGAHCGSQRFM